MCCPSCPSRCGRSRSASCASSCRGEEEGDDAPLDARFDELAHLVGKRVEVQMEDIRGVPRWFAGKARSATRRRGLQVSFDDGERKAFHADEINDASQGTFWRFE